MAPTMTITTIAPAVRLVGIATSERSLALVELAQKDSHLFLEILYLPHVREEGGLTRREGGVRSEGVPLDKPVAGGKTRLFNEPPLRHLSGLRIQVAARAVEIPERDALRKGFVLLGGAQY